MARILERRRLLRKKFRVPTPSLFLDRDGVLIEDKHHLSDPAQVILCPGSKQLVEAAYKNSWAVVVITNQSGIARGYFDWSDYERVTDRLLCLLETSTPVAGIYANGYGPDAPKDSWRKPSPAMLQEASRELNLDLQRSLLIGDRLSDLEAGARAGVQKLIHVLTGHGQRERDRIETWLKREQKDYGLNPKTELYHLDTLLNFPLSLLRQSK